MPASYALDVSAQRKRPDRHSTDRGRAAGRYDGGRTPLPPGGQLATMPREANRAALEKRLKQAHARMRRVDDPADLARLQGDVERLQAALAEVGEHVAAVSVVDPMGDGRSTIRASVNRRTDVLEVERSHSRISDAAYRAGRTVQDVLEKAGRIGGSSWDMTPGDRTTTQNGAVARAMERAQDTRRMVSFIEGRLGMIDARLLRRVLGDRMSFADCAALQGKAGEKGANYVARRVRDALEDLADAFASKGRAQPTPDDAYKAAASEMVARQDAALAGGATLQRLEAELVGLEAGESLAPGRDREREVGQTKTAIAGMRLRQAEAAFRRQR